ncbi:hypothetical protein ACFFLM_04650 [Deinococcus oregonensis]|uniref:Uncharacterized protein n=1 Tax=Deinococcus oregonensis TaxID=1805970 RepID=A0ABV6AUT9_9DEIO
MRQVTKFLLGVILDFPVVTLVVVALVFANLSTLLPQEFYTNGVGKIAGIGFTMLGFSIAATSILSSVFSVPSILQMRNTDTWKALTSTFTRANVLFLVMGIFGLVVYEKLFDPGTLYGQILQATYMAILGATFIASIGIIFVLHKIVTTPLTAQERAALANSNRSSFAPPDPTPVVIGDPAAVATVEISSDTPN